MAPHADIQFQLEGTTVFYHDPLQKAGRRRRIAGVISTEQRDRQNEIVIQKGLDFGPFLEHGWFNDNHAKDTDAAVGYPTKVQQFQKGAVLPNGQTAKHNCTWAEGYLLEGSGDAEIRADKLWKMGLALQKSDGARALGFSIEGAVVKRTGAGKRVVAKAVVTNCAITNCPVNPGTKMEMLAKSLRAAQYSLLPDDVQKALSMGSPPAGNASPAGASAQGEGAGQILTPQSLEKDVKPLTQKELEERKKKNKKLSKAEAYALLRTRLPPKFPDSFIDRVIEVAIHNGRQATHHRRNP